MNWLTLDDPLKIMKIFRYLITNRIGIKIHFEGKGPEFTSKFIKINQDDSLSEIGKKSELIIGKLFPEEGNSLIQSSQKFSVEFPVNQNLFHCDLKYIGISSISPYLGYILLYPKSIKIAEKRKKKRTVYERPNFISVEFRLRDAYKEDRLYELNVFDCSQYGLGIIVPPEYFDLLQKIKVGDKLENITFYSARARININGTVRHMTKMEAGKYKGNYILGIESPEIIDN